MVAGNEHSKNEVKETRILENSSAGGSGTGTCARRNNESEKNGGWEEVFMIVA